MAADGMFSLRLRPLPARHGTRKEPAYVLEGFAEGRWFSVPVHPRTDSEGYRVEVMGLILEEARLPALLDAVGRLLEALTYAGRFPRYALGIPAAGVALPVYPWGSGWRIYEPDGPILEAGNLGALRQRLAEAHWLPEEAIAVWALSEALTWVSPAAVFRPAAASLPWWPIVRSRSGWELDLDGERWTAPGDGAGGWSLWERVAARGIQRGWLPTVEDLVLEVWDPGAWAAWAEVLVPAAFCLRFYEAGPRLHAVRLPVYRLGGRWGAVGSEGARRIVFWGRDLEDLRGRVGAALHMAGRLADPQGLRIEKALDPSWGEGGER